MDFPRLLVRFAEAVQRNDGAGLAALFTPDGVYEDGFFGPHGSPDAIVAMLQRFHDGGRDYWWEFHTPVLAGDTGYASWRFSYASRRQGVEGHPVLFEGLSRFTLRDGRIAHYYEIFDRGPAAGIASVSAKAAARQNAKPENRWHLARFGPTG
jgi:ketosteroid isomerase-like protein